MIADKTKAAMPGRLSHNALLKRNQITRLVADGQRTSQLNFEDADFIQLFSYPLDFLRCSFLRFLRNDSKANSTGLKSGGSVDAFLGFSTFGCFAMCQPFGSDLAFLRCRRLISPFAAVIRNPAVLSPSSFSFSISSKSSRGSLTESCKERLFFLPVAITETSYLRWCSVYTAKLIIKHLKWCSLTYTLVVFTLSTVKTQVRHKTAKPRGALTPSGLLTKPLVEVTVMAGSQHTQTHPKFTWRFLALNRHDKKATPCRLSVEAATEREARRILAPHFILSLAARLPLQEVRHV